MNIRDTKAYIENFWDWSVLNDCFGDTTIRVTDIDGLVERKGKFLLIETKMPDNPVPQGQGIMLEALCKNGAFTVIVVWGQVNKPDKFLLWGEDHYRPCSVYILKDFVQQWFEWANTKSRESFKYEYKESGVF